MLAFNLAVFFRNLHGEPVRLVARGERAGLRFVGSVEGLEETTDLTRRLTVTLGRAELLCRLELEEELEPDEDAPPTVHIRLSSRNGAEPTVLAEAAFRFEDIQLQPATAPTDAPARGD